MCTQYVLSLTVFAQTSSEAIIVFRMEEMYYSERSFLRATDPAEGGNSGRTSVWIGLGASSIKPYFRVIRCWRRA